MKMEETDKDQPTRILLVEDHTSFRQAMAFLIGADPSFEVVAEAGSISEAREVIGGEARPRIAIVDLGLPDGDGIELVREFATSKPAIATLVLSASVDRVRFAQAVEAGAAGFLHKASAVREVVGALRRLRAGEALLSPNEVIELLREADKGRQEELATRLRFESLTPRELQVLEALAEGLDSKEVARALHITPETERTHVVNILNKLGASSRLQAVVYAARHGLVDI